MNDCRNDDEGTEGVHNYTLVYSTILISLKFFESNPTNAQSLLVKTADIQLLGENIFST